MHIGAKPLGSKGFISELCLGPESSSGWCWLVSLLYEMFFNAR